MVYIDDVRLGFGRMKMCHMIADTTDELLEMADRIGEHFDVCLAKRAKAVGFGAVEITSRQLGIILRDRRLSVPVFPPLEEA